VNLERDPIAPKSPIGIEPEILRNVLEAAILAPSPWNCQPWRFEIGDGAVHVIHPHRSPLLHDIDNHATLISFGAVLENIVIAARSAGRPSSIEYFPEDGNPYFVAELRFEEASPTPADPLADAIPKRRTTRSPFTRRPLDRETAVALRSVIAGDDRLRLHLVDAPFEKRELSDLLIRAERIMWGNLATRRTLLSRMGSGDLPPDQVVGGRWRRWWVEHLLRRRWRDKINPYFLLRNVSRRKILVRTSHIGVVSLAECEPRAYLDAGRAIQRMWLELTARHASVEPLCDIIGLMMAYNLKVSSLVTGRRTQAARKLTEDFNRLFRLPFGRTAVYLFRVGWPTSETPPPPSPRRPLIEFVEPRLGELLRNDQAR
jgi:nitroreductase